MSIELHNVCIRECEIDSSVVNNHISLSVYQNVAGDFSIRIHHNHIKLQSSTGIEFGLDNAIVDSNFFEVDVDNKCDMVMKDFKPGGVIRNTIFRYNVCSNFNTGLLGMKSAMKQWQIDHNTYIAAGRNYGWGVFEFQYPGSDSLYLRNNIILHFRKNTPVYRFRGDHGAERPTNFVVEGNIFYADPDSMGEFAELFFIIEIEARRRKTVPVVCTIEQTELLR